MLCRTKFTLEVIEKLFVQTKMHNLKNAKKDAPQTQKCEKDVLQKISKEVQKNVLKEEIIVVTPYQLGL
jgi:hypothetical protein